MRSRFASRARQIQTTKWTLSRREMDTEKQKGWINTSTCKKGSWIPALGSPHFSRCRCSHCYAVFAETHHWTSLRKPPLESPVRIGNRLIVKDGLSGVVKYIGDLNSSYTNDPVFIGVKLDVPVGEHDGMFKGKRFFSCANHHGIIVPINEVLLRSDGKRVIKMSQSLPRSKHETISRRSVSRESSGLQSLLSKSWAQNHVSSRPSSAAAASFSGRTLSNISSTSATKTASSTPDTTDQGKLTKLLEVEGVINTVKQMPTDEGDMFVEEAAGEKRQGKTVHDNTPCITSSSRSGRQTGHRRPVTAPVKIATDSVTPYSGPTECSVGGCTGTIIGSSQFSGLSGAVQQYSPPHLNSYTGHNTPVRARGVPTVWPEEARRSSSILFPTGVSTNAKVRARGVPGVPTCWPEKTCNSSSGKTCCKTDPTQVPKGHNTTIKGVKRSESDMKKHHSKKVQNGGACCMIGPILLSLSDNEEQPGNEKSSLNADASACLIGPILLPAEDLGCLSDKPSPSEELEDPRDTSDEDGPISHPSPPPAPPSSLPSPLTATPTSPPSPLPPTAPPPLPTPSPPPPAPPTSPPSPLPAPSTSPPARPTTPATVASTTSTITVASASQFQEIEREESLTSRLISRLPCPNEDDPVEYADKTLEDVVSCERLMERWGWDVRAWFMTNTYLKLKIALQRGAKERVWQKEIHEREKSNPNLARRFRKLRTGIKLNRKAKREVEAGNKTLKKKMRHKMTSLITNKTKLKCEQEKMHVMHAKAISYPASAGETKDLLNIVQGITH